LSRGLRFNFGSVALVSMMVGILHHRTPECKTSLGQFRSPKLKQGF